MKLFLDCSDAELIKTYYETGLIDGVTTNPSLMLKAGEEPMEVYKKISEIFPFHASISAEVVGETAQEMLDHGRTADQHWTKHYYQGSMHTSGLKACKDLTDDDVSVNVTLVFSESQAILASKAGATYVSPFVGRVFDQSFDGIGLVEGIADVFATHGSKTQVLAASIREVYQVEQAFKRGADICTIPSKVFAKMYSHILTDKGLEIFDRDWKNLQAELGEKG